MSGIDQFHDGVPIDGGGDRLAKLHILKPRLLSGDIVSVFLEVVEIKYQEVVLEARPQVEEFGSMTRRIFGQQRIVVRAESADDVGLASLKTNDLGVFVSDKKKNQFVEIRKAIFTLVGFPVIRISFEYDPLAGNVLFHSKWPHAGNFSGWRSQSPCLGELASFIWLFQQMPRHHREAVENSLGGSVGLGQRETHRVLINLLYLDWLPAHHQQITLRRMNFLVEVNLERKHYIVGVERLTVRETETVPQLDGESLTIFRDAPGLCQGRLSCLRGAIDVNQICRQPADDFPRRRIGCSDRIQRFGLAPLRHYQTAAVAANLVVCNV